MNAYSITFQTVLNAFRHQWKRLLVFVLLFALLGGAAGFLLQGRGMAEAGGSAKPLDPVDFAQVARTRDYYTDCLDMLADTMNNLNKYIATISANALTAADDAPETELLDALERAVAELRSDRLTPLCIALNEKGAVYAPEEYLDGLADLYTRELAALRMDLISAEAATETIRQMDAPNYEETSQQTDAPDYEESTQQTDALDYGGDIPNSYGSLLFLASRYPTLLCNQAVLEKYLDDLTNHMPEIQAECRRVERELETARGELNAILDNFTPLADGLAKEKGLTFTPTVEGGKTDIVVTHSHRASSAEETFSVTMIFCVLVGVCVGAFFAVCREAKEEKSRLSGQPEGQSPDTSL